MIGSSTPFSAPVESTTGTLRCLRWQGAAWAQSRPSLVFLHGLGDGADVWRQVVTAWPTAQHAGAIAWDLPGHGGSARLPAAEYSVEEFARIVIEALVESRLSLPVIVGHSLGARVACRVAADPRCRPSLLALVDLNPDHRAGVSDAVGDHLDALSAAASGPDELVDRVAARLPLCDRGRLAELIPQLVEAGETVEGRAEYALPLDPNLRSLLRRATSDDDWQALRSLDCPIAVVRGAFSSALDSRTAHRMAATVARRAGLETVQSAGHAVPLEQPAALAEALGRLVEGALRALR